MKRFIISMFVVLCGIPCCILLALMYVCCAPLALIGWAFIGDWDVYPWVDKFNEKFTKLLN